MLLAWGQTLEVLEAGNLKGPIADESRLLGFFSREEPVRADAQGLGNVGDVARGAAALDFRDRCLCEVGLVRELLLSEVELFAAQLDPSPDRLMSHARSVFAQLWRVKNYSNKILLTKK